MARINQKTEIYLRTKTEVDFWQGSEIDGDSVAITK